MLQVEEALLDSVTAALYHLRTGKVPPPIAIPEDLPENEVRQLITFLNRFLSENICYNDYSQYVEAL